MIQDIKYMDMKHYNDLISKNDYLGAATYAKGFTSNDPIKRKNLEKGSKVKASIRFKGRQIAHPELAKEVLDKFALALEDIAEVEIVPKIEGRSMFTQLTPKK